MKATELLKKLLTKAGINIEGEIGDEIPDETATALDNALLTIQAATNNHPKVKNKYFADAYNGLDAEIKDLITEFNIPDDARAEIEQINNSPKRIIALARKIKELSEKSTPVDKSKAAELQAEVTKLHNQLNAELKKQADLQNDYEKKLKNVKTQVKLDVKKSKYKTVYDDLDPEAKDAAINAIVNKALVENDAEFSYDEKGNLTLQKSDGSNLFGDNHTIMTPDTFLDKTLSKILKVTTPGQTPVTPGNAFSYRPLTSVQAGEQGKPNTQLNQALSESLAAFEQSAKNGF